MITQSDEASPTTEACLVCAAWTHNLDDCERCDAQALLRKEPEIFCCTRHHAKTSLSQLVLTIHTNMSLGGGPPTGLDAIGSARWRMASETTPLLLPERSPSQEMLYQLQHRGEKPRSMQDRDGRRGQDSFPKG